MTVTNPSDIVDTCERRSRAPRSEVWRSLQEVLRSSNSVLRGALTHTLCSVMCIWHTSAASTTATDDDLLVRASKGAPQTSWPRAVVCRTNSRVRGPVGLLLHQI
jgi:hypothetical protein